MRCIAPHPHLDGMRTMSSYLHASVCHLDPGLHHLGRLVGSRGSLLKSLSSGTCCHCSYVVSLQLLQRWQQ